MPCTLPRRRASQVRLNVRGICCLRPGVPGLSENISVVSIVGRFLEHARIFYFHHGGDERVYISSADWMPRNLDRRVELLVPVEDAVARRRLINVMEVFFRDTVKARKLRADGTYQRVEPEGRQKPLSSQEYLYREAVRAVQERRAIPRDGFRATPSTRIREHLNRRIMKTLLLLRHAKSSWDDPSQSDHDRPLNDRGKHDAPRVGLFLREAQLKPDLVISSTAKRARKTAAKAIAAAEWDMEVDLRQDLYLANIGTWVQVLRSLPDACGCVLAVGHNPGIEDLVHTLSGIHRPTMPTAALAHLELPLEHWSDLAIGMRGVLHQVWTP